jgi:geranylgeranyl transferase type-2 subunit alpha
VKVDGRIVSPKVADSQHGEELLPLTTQILKLNPEYYTFWNHRRRIYSAEFKSILSLFSRQELTEENRNSQILDLINLDLQFLLPLLIQFPKCYWIWNHRLWLLEQANILLPAAKTCALWEEELQLVGKMLNRDGRNFHGWGYRRTIITNLEDSGRHGRSMTRSELDYTTKMINSNLSNFSAWHNRTQLILKILAEQSADDEERKEMLDDGELKGEGGVGSFSSKESDVLTPSRDFFDPSRIVRPLRSITLVSPPKPVVCL